MNDAQIWNAVKLGVGLVLVLVVAGMWGCPQYNVYEQRLKGEAALSRAEGQRQILVTQAHAEREAAVQRAEAIKIVGQAAKDFPEYRQQEFIGAFAEALKDGHVAQIIYVPTEANIPITEAHRLAAEAKK
jgi:regulator of protease activity HflC (stomatin/prohibitin superfamily)